MSLGYRRIVDEKERKRYREAEEASLGVKFFESEVVDPAELEHGWMKYDPITNTIIGLPTVQMASGYSISSDCDELEEEAEDVYVFDESATPPYKKFSRASEAEASQEEDDSHDDEDEEEQDLGTKPEAKGKSILNCPANLSGTDFQPHMNQILGVMRRCDHCRPLLNDLVISGTKPEAKGRSMLKRPHEALSESTETFVENQDLVIDSSTPTASGTEHEAKGRSMLKRPHEALSESTETFVENQDLGIDSSTSTASGNN